jgi:formiminotetrahydrofolate cyclodeaminase
LSKAATSLWTLTAAQLRDKVSSSDPTPGGGSVSIIAAALAVASIHKGVAVSLKKLTVDSARRKCLLDIGSKTSSLMASLSELADADSQAFQDYLEASALPRTTEADKAIRKAAREASLVRATQVPLEAAVEMGRGLAYVEAAVELVDGHVRSEVLAGGLLIRASIRSVLLSVDANLPGISDASLGASLKRRREELERALTAPDEPAST